MVKELVFENGDVRDADADEESTDSEQEDEEADES